MTSGNTKIRLRGIEADVEILRDRWGIPHIRAQSARDAFFAQGFAHAQDRMWQMEWDRRRAMGTTAELIGQPGVEADRLARRFQIERAAKADWEILNDETRAMVESYADGVNSFLESNPVPSIEFEKLKLRVARWEPWHSLCVFKIRHVMMGTFNNKLWRLRVVQKLGRERARELFPTYRDGHPLIIPPGEIYRRGKSDQGWSHLHEAIQLLPGAGGSNNWVVDGTKTKSGKPLLAADPHRALDVPNVYYQNHLMCDQFDAIGVSFPGVPAFPHFSHNARVAWGVTHAQADYQDLYIERFDSRDDSRYEYKGVWLTAEISDDLIRVKGGADVIDRVRRTRHGPIIQDGPLPHHAIAMRYTDFEPNKTFECLLPMLRTNSTDEFRDAQREWIAPVQNLIFADVDGNIGYHTRGRLPKRSESNGWLPVPGWSDEHEWRGYIPFEVMPQTCNPSSHTIITANNKIIDDDYPHYITADPSPGYRYARIFECLAPMKAVTVGDFAALQADRLSIAAREFVPHLLAAHENMNDDVLEYLRAWDYRMDPESVAATIYATTRDALMRLLLIPILGEEMTRAMLSGVQGASRHAAMLRYHLSVFIESNDTRLLDAHDPDRANWHAALRAAFRIAVKHLHTKLGDDMSQWQWSRVHMTAPVHPLSALPEIGEQFNPPRAPYGGDADTVQQGGYASGLGYSIANTQVYRQIIDLSDWSKSRWVVPLGASGIPASAHFADQVRVWQENRNIPMLYDWTKIEADKKSQTILRATRKD